MKYVRKTNRVEQRKRDPVADATVIVNVPQRAELVGGSGPRGAKVSKKNKNMTEEGLKERMDGLPQRGGTS